jgi:hypothetical protein
MKDLPISLIDQPGSLAALGEATGRASINMEGACAYVEDGKAVAHIRRDRNLVRSSPDLRGRL